MELIKRPVDIMYSDAVTGTEMSAVEKEIIITLFAAADEEVSLIIPDNIKPSELIPILEASIGAAMRLERANNKLKPFLGRMFALISERKDLLDSMEFPGIVGPENFTDFMKRVVPLRWGMNVSEAYACMRMAKEYYFLSPEELTEIGKSKLKMISIAVPREGGQITESVKRVRQDIAEVAKTTDHSGLADYIEARGLCDRETLTPIRIIIQSNAALNALWYDWITGPVAIGWAGSKDPNVILEAMIAECTEVWGAAIKAAKGM